MTRAGLPTTTARGGTSFVTTAPAPTKASSPISTPGQRIAPPPTRAPRRIVGPSISAGGSGSRVAVERGESVGCLPTTAPSSTLTPSPSTVPGYTIALGWISASATQRLGQPVERAHHAQPVARLAVVSGPVGDEIEEMLHLEAQRLVVRDLGAEDVAGARAPLAVGLGRLPRRLVVDRDLALELHVVED